MLRAFVCLLFYALASSSAALAMLIPMPRAHCLLAGLFSVPASHIATSLFSSHFPLEKTAADIVADMRHVGVYTELWGNICRKAVRTLRDISAL